MKREFDCIVCGETCVDLTIRPIDRKRPLAEQGTVLVDPIVAGTGGIVPNSGMALARMGMKAAGLGCVGMDDWGAWLIRRLNDSGLSTDSMVRLPQAGTSVTAILVDESGDHNFAFHAGASAEFRAGTMRDQRALFQNSRFMLLGYYGLLSDELMTELPDLLQDIRAQGCRTALDAAAGGGRLQPLDQLLPHLDLYVPSREEATAQTGCSDAQDMIRVFRRLAPSALLGVKLGADGALLSPAAGEWVHVPPVTPPGNIVDTTGAGDCFYAGLICGLVRGFSTYDAGRLGAAAGACSVTQPGATAGLPEFDDLLRLSKSRC